MHSRLDAIEQSLAELHRKADRIMSAQDDLNALATDINTRVTELGTAQTAIQAEIAKLETQGVDTSWIKAAVALLDPAVDGIAAIVPAPAPAPAPSPAPSGS